MFFAQPITFESMRVAKNEASNIVEVELLTTQYKEDRKIIPNYFTVLPNLQRSVTDVNTKLKSRKLPLIKDILNSLKENSTAEYFIYTNVDIGLLPNFYKEVVNYINEGHDAIIINRRRLKSKYQSIADLKEIYKEKGKSHPGFDCFVFKKSLLEKFVLDEVCVGIPFLGVSLAYNIFSFADYPKYVFDKYLTFHIGEDVLPIRNNAFYKHNFNSFFRNIKPKLKENFKLNNFPYYHKNWFLQLIKFGLNPSLQTRDFLELKFPSYFKYKEIKNKYKHKEKLFKMKRILNEVRWWLLSL